MNKRSCPSRNERCDGLRGMWSQGANEPSSSTDGLAHRGNALYISSVTMKVARTKNVHSIAHYQFLYTSPSTFYRKSIHSRHQKTVKITTKLEPANMCTTFAAPSGVYPVSPPPRYQLPMSVSLPFWLSMAPFGPTFETSLRKAPK